MVRGGRVLRFEPRPTGFPGSFEAELAQAQIAKLEKEPLVVAGGDPVEEEPPEVAAPSPAEVEKNLDLSREHRRLVQLGLAAAGHAPGPADGMFGGRTRRALQAWQESKEVEGTGYLTREQGEVLAALGREELKREARVAEQQSQAEARRKERKRADDAAFARAKSQGTVSAFNGYLASCDLCGHAVQARRLMNEAKRPARKPGDKFRDCPGCPEMVVVPSGSYRMGSPSSEKGRYDDEDPVHRVAIGRPFAVGVHEVTRGEFGRFVSESGRSMGNSCWEWDGEWKKRSGRSWKNPGFSQTDSNPVVCVSWNDAKAYVRWLSGKTGKKYRLLSEAEWEYVARGGTKTARYWGESESGQCRYANGADEALKRWDRDWKWKIASCDDGHARPSPVGSFQANGFGLHDVLGNVIEWTEDCWNESYRGAPSDGTAWESGDCGRRVLRGGSWSGSPSGLRSANRFRNPSGDRSSFDGFRVARTLTP